MNEVTYVFNIDEVNILLKGLAELPAKESYQMINKLYEGVRKAQEPAPEMQNAPDPGMTVVKGKKG